MGRCWIFLNPPAYPSTNPNHSGRAYHLDRPNEMSSPMFRTSVRPAPATTPRSCKISRKQIHSARGNGRVPSSHYPAKTEPSTS